MAMTHIFRSRRLQAAALAVSASAAIGCGDVARTGRAPAFLIIEALEADSGADDSQEFSSSLLSDVQTFVEEQRNGQTVRIPTRFNDQGRVRLRLALKNPGTAALPTTPSTLNEVTISRYRVTFSRTDGRNTQGLDVPYAFEGGLTVTVPAQGTVEAAFDLVRHTSKSEPPLSNLIGGGSSRFINAIAEVTFYGRDQAGNDLSVSGLVNVTFADFGDPR